MLVSNRDWSAVPKNDTCIISHLTEVGHIVLIMLECCQRKEKKDSTVVQLLASPVGLCETLQADNVGYI